MLYSILDIQTKHTIAWCLLLASIPIGIILTSISQRLRDGAFFLMVALTVITEKIEVHFFSYWWYRGSSRGLEFSFIDVLALSVLVSSFLFPRQRPRFFLPAGLGPMLLFFAYAAVSIVFLEPRVYGGFEIIKVARGILYFLSAALFVRSERELTILAVALCSTVCFEGALCAKETLEGVYRVTGSLDHANSLSMFLCLVTPPCVAAAGSTLPKWVRRYALLATVAASLSIVLTLSRAGIPIFAFVVGGTALFAVSFRFSVKQLAAVGLIAVCLLGMLYKFGGEIVARFGGSLSLREDYLDDNAVESRGFYLRLARVIMEDRFFGVGFNNWSYWVSKKYGRELDTKYDDYDALTWEQHDVSEIDYNYAPPAHNLGALTVGELGIPGLFLFSLMWLRWFHMGSRFLFSRTPQAMQRMAVGLFFGVCGVFLQSITEWVYRQSNIYFTLHIMVGALAALVYQRTLGQKKIAGARPTAARSGTAPMPDALRFARGSQGGLCGT